MSDRPVYGTWEPVVLMITQTFKLVVPARIKVDAEHRGGSTRSSEEVSVMGNGAKGLSYSVVHYHQPVWEE